MKTLKMGLGLGLITMLSACVTITNNEVALGGEPIIMQYPVETALLNIYTQPRTETLTEVNSTQNRTIDTKVTPKGIMEFEGKRVQGAEYATVTKVGGNVVSRSTSINYFTLNPARFYGYTDSSGAYSVATQTADLPKVARVGDKGTLITENVYSDSSKRNQISRYQQSWSLTQASPTTAWFCISTSQNLLSPVSDSSTVECYNIDAKGDILNSKATASIPTANGIETVTYTSR
nr:hypothetical protein [uncultured Psychrobacter sp.]